MRVSIMPQQSDANSDAGTDLNTHIFNKVCRQKIHTGWIRLLGRMGHPGRGPGSWWPS